MAGIRIYQPQLSPSGGSTAPRATAEDFGSQVGGALGALGGALTGAAVDSVQVDARIAAIRAARDEEDAQAAAAKGLAELEARQKLAAMQARETAAPDGKGHSDAVMSAFDKERDAYLSGIGNAKVRSWAETRAAGLRGDIEVSEAGWEAGARVAKTFGDFRTTINTLGNTLYTAPSAKSLTEKLQIIDDTVATMTGPADAKAKEREAARARLGRSYLEGLAEKDPYQARAILRTGTLNDVIDADSATAIGNRIDAEVNARQAAARAAQAEARREAHEAERERRETARDFVSGIQASLQAGVPVPPSVIGQAASLARRINNPGGALAIETLGFKNGLTIEYRKASPRQLQDRINALGGKSDAQSLIERDHLGTLLGNMKTELANDPLSWGAKAGVVAVQPININDPASIASRRQAARAVASRYGTPVRLLTDEEAAGLTQTLSTGSIEQKTALTASLRAMGGDAQTVMAQIAPKDRLAAHIAGLATGRAPALARDAWRGIEALKSDPKIIDRSLADAAFRKATSGVLHDPAMLGTVRQAADAIYAARKSASGELNWNKDSYRAAIDAALGAYQGGDGKLRGGLGTWRGAAVALPDNTTQEMFDDALDRLDDRALAGANGPTVNGKPVSAELVKSGRLEAFGNGRYRVNLGGGWLTTRSGAPFVLELRPSGARP